MVQMLDQQVRFTWNIHYACNFRCSYCFFEGKWEEYAGRNVYLSVNEWVDYWFRIYEKYGRCYILITGGEPFTYPNFIELMVKLSQLHYPINISSNASVDLEFFASCIDPGRISLSISFQPEFATFDDFLKKVKFLRRNKIEGCINFVAYPPYIKEIEGYRKRLWNIGQTLKVIPFWGQYEGREYPSAYSRQEKEAINIDSSWEKKVRKKGTLCIAGQKTALIFPDGKVARCGQIGEKMVIGSFFDSGFKLLDNPLPCLADACPCDEGVVWPESELSGDMPSEESGRSITLSITEDINKTIRNESQAVDSFISQRRLEDIDSLALKEKIDKLKSNIGQIPIGQHKDLLADYANVMARLSRQNSRLNDREFESKKVNLKSLPKAVFLQFAGPCNSSCVFCSRGQGYECFDLSKFRKRLESKIGYGLSLAEQFIFTGSGEFLRLPQWKEILDYFDYNYPHIDKMFSTNGSSLRPEVCQKITSQKSRYLIHVSLHASNAELHRALTRTDNFHTIIEQVKYLQHLRRKSANIGLNFIFVATTLNINDLPDFIRFASQNGADKVVVYYNFIYVPAQKYLSCFFKPLITNKMLDEAESLARDLELDLQLPPRFEQRTYAKDGICRELWSQIMFNDSGHVLPCDASVDCNVRLEDKTYEEVWNSNYYLRVRRQLLEQGQSECFSHCLRANPMSVNEFTTHVIRRGRKGEKIDLFWADDS